MRAYKRSAAGNSPRVRTYEMIEDLPEDVLDDVLPTGHQRDISEGDRPAGYKTSEQPVDDLRQGQILPRDR